jgi:hypothetical protein
MSKTKVLLLGATGETGASILEGLAADGTFVGSSQSGAGSEHRS